MKRIGSIIFSLLVLCGLSVHAQEIAAEVTNDHPHVGEPVQLTVTLRGARGAEVPHTLSVKGLRIQLVGQSTQVQMLNMRMSFAAVYTYVVIPEAAGDYTIPAFEVKAGGHVLHTQPIQLSVEGSTQPPSLLPNAPPQSSRNENENETATRPYFGELLISKKKAYVGEVIPTELRFYFNARYTGKVGERPSFGGEGFTVQKFSNASQREVVVDGETYVVFSFQTSITPVKSGPLEIPPAKLQALLNMPSDDSSQGLPGIFRGFGSMFTETQEVTLETKSATLDVVPLPKEGRPNEFSGAIGKFTLEASVNPKKVAGGEPVTLTAIISGQGNFEAMGAPVLTNDDGWRSYPPSDKFESSDSIQFSGKKTFEFPLIARHDQNLTPGLKFSYFDPSAQKYVTLTRDSFDVEVKAGAVPTATALPSPPPQTTPAPSIREDIVVTGGGASSWKALLLRKRFLIANGALAGLWLAFFSVFAFRKFARSSAALEKKRRRKSRSLLGRLRHADDDSFYAFAIAYLCSRLGVENSVIAATACLESSSLPAELKSRLEGIIDRYDESKYAAGVVVKPGIDERSQVIATLDEFDKQYEK